MHLSHPSHDAAHGQPTGNSDVEDLGAVMDMLQSIIAEENDFLRSGLPASLFEWKAFKQDLADQYAWMWRRVAADIADGARPNPDVLRALFEQARELRTLTVENLHLLDGAITATRRRIEAVIMAARAGDAAASHYDGKGVSAITCAMPRVTRMSA